MTITDRIKLYFMRKEARAMLDAIKLPLQKYAPIVTGVMGVLVVVTGFLFGPYTAGGVTIPHFDAKTVVQIGWPVILWIIHHVSKPAVAATPASIPAAK
jgi:Ni,Fe-hydrogenase I cytochrome b subunit